MSGFQGTPEAVFRGVQGDNRVAGARGVRAFGDDCCGAPLPGQQGAGWIDQRLRGTALAVAVLAALVAVLATALKLASATSLACFTAFCTDS